MLWIWLGTAFWDLLLLLPVLFCDSYILIAFFSGMYLHLWQFKVTSVFHFADYCIHVKSSRVNKTIFTVVFYGCQFHTVKLRNSFSRYLVLWLIFIPLISFLLIFIRCQKWKSLQMPYLLIVIIVRLRFCCRPRNFHSNASVLGGGRGGQNIPLCTRIYLKHLWSSGGAGGAKREVAIIGYHYKQLGTSHF